jgi:hypothetical protein
MNKSTRPRVHPALGAAINTSLRTMQHNPRNYLEVDAPYIQISQSHCGCVHYGLLRACLRRGPKC